MPTRDTLHQLIDELPESELAAAERFLHYLRATADPVRRALLEAPPDDEPETDEERQAVQEAREELARGEVRTLAAVRRAWGRCAGETRDRRPGRHEEAPGWRTRRSHQRSAGSTGSRSSCLR